MEISHLSHQHLSNILHHSKLVLGVSEPLEIRKELETRFGGIQLPYHPMISFVDEILHLQANGYTTGKPNAQIVVDGKWIGEIKYT
jgi:hypothetical protein